MEKQVGVVECWSAESQDSITPILQFLTAVNPVIGGDV
jgi:hypothetical protein